jgi:hypothetical protein
MAMGARTSAKWRHLLLLNESFEASVRLNLHPAGGIEPAPPGRSALAKLPAAAEAGVVRAESGQVFPRRGPDTRSFAADLSLELYHSYPC